MRTRLLCLALLTASPAIAQTEKVGDWEIKTTKDGFTDTARGIATSPITEGGTMVIKCDKFGPGSLYTVFITRQYLGSGLAPGGGFYTAQYRLDDAPVASMTRLIYNGKVAGLTSDQAGEFLKLLATQKPSRFRARFMSYSSQVVDFDTQVAGIADAIQKTAEICGDTAFSQ